jgi:DHA2 family multidrug resistance protein
VATFVDQSVTSAVFIASPAIAGSLAASVDESLWINIAFSAPYYVAIVLSPWTLRRFGYRNQYIGSLACVCIASLFCATAQQFEWLLLWRFTQGAALGSIFVSTLYAIVINFEPDFRRLAFALYGVFSLGGPALGPLLGGLAVDDTSWRTLFFGIASASLASALLLYAGLKPAAPAEHQPFDIAGVLFLATAAVAYQIATQYGELRDWFGDPYVTLSIAVCVIALFGLFLRRGHEMWRLLIPRILVGERRFRASIMAGIGLGVPLLGATVFVSFLGGPLLLTPTLAGLLLGLRVFAIVIFAPIFTLLSLSAAVDTRILIGLGFICTAASYTLEGIATTTGSAPSSFFFAVLLSGLGFSAIFSPLVLATVGAAGFAIAPQTLALLKLSFTLGGSVATTALGTLLDHAGAQYRSDLASSLTGSRAAVRAFLSTHPRGIADLSGLLSAQAQTLAFADAAYWTAIATLLFLLLVPFLPVMKRVP